MITNESTTNHEGQIEKVSLPTTESVGTNPLDNVTVYYGVSVKRRKTSLRPVSLSAVIQEMVSDETRKDIELIRAEKNDVKRAELKKNRLHYFTFSEFIGNLPKNKTFRRTKYLLFDLDHLGERLEEVRKLLIAERFTFLLFLSPSGDGLKLVVELDEYITDFKLYCALHKYYASVIGTKFSVVVDPATHDAARACFVSYDPGIFVNPSHQLLSTKVELPPEELKEKSHTRKELIEISKGAKEGSRNDSVLANASIFHARNIDEDFALNFLTRWNKGNETPLPEEELTATVKHVYADYPSVVTYDVDFPIIKDGLKKSKSDDVTVAKHLFEWFKENREAQFFTDDQGNHYIYLNDNLIPLDEHNSDFQALLLQAGNISMANISGRVACQVLNASAHMEGTHIKKNTWLYTDLEKLSVYVNLKNDRNELIRISQDGITLVANGRNDDHVFILNTPEDKLDPIAFSQLSETELEAELKFAESNIINHIAADEEDKWFAYSWRMSYPLFDFTTSHLITRFQGKKDGGKTTATLLMSSSLYGQNWIDKSTVAGLYSDASVNPLVLDDNLESKNFYGEEGRADFYLGAATGGGRQKRDQSTRSGLIHEKTRALVLCNGIESIAKSEQTTRMMIIQCDRFLHNSNYTSSVLFDIKRNRNRLLSAEFLVTQRVLQRIGNGDWRSFQERLQKDHPDHTKSRMFEHIALIILYIDEMWKILGKSEDVWALVNKWMDKQKETSEQEIIGTDPIIQALDIVKDSAIKQEKLRKTHIATNAKEEVEKQRMIPLNVDSLLVTVTVTDDVGFVLEGTAGNLVSAFSTAFQVHLKKQFPIEKSRILTQRIANVKDELMIHGYELTFGEDKHDKQRIYTFTHSGKA